MYGFPSDPAVRAKWVQFVRRHRHDFKDPSIPRNIHRSVRHTLKTRAMCEAHRFLAAWKLRV